MIELVQCHTAQLGVVRHMLREVDFQLTMRTNRTACDVVAEAQSELFS